jgi:hypothetical protein
MRTVYVEKRLRKSLCEREGDVSAKMALPRVANCG